MSQESARVRALGVLCLCLYLAKKTTQQLVMPITVALEGGRGCTSLEEEQRRPWGLSGQAGSERLTEKKRQIDCLVIMGMKAYCSSLTTQTQAQDNNTHICMVHVDCI